MKISGLKTKVEMVDIEVSPYDLYFALRREVLSKFDLPGECYLKRGQVVIDEEYHTSHSWTETVMLQPKPTAEVVAVIKAFDTVHATMVAHEKD